LKESPKFLAQKEASDDTEGFLDVLKNLFHSDLRGTTLATTICWIAASVSFYGVTYAAGNLSPNLYMNLVLLATVDLIGYLMPGVLLKCLKPQLLQILGFFGAAVCFLGGGFFMAGSMQSLLFALAGRLFLDIAWTTCFILIPSCFPTRCCAAAMGVANTFSRLCSFLAPFGAVIPLQNWCQLLSALCFTACLSSQFLRVLPELSASAAPRCLSKAEEGQEKEVVKLGI